MEEVRYLRAYLDALMSRFGMAVAIKDYAGFTAKEPAVAWPLSAYCIHQSPYCLALKAHRALWDRCQRSSRALMRRCRSGEPFTGQCYAGCSELVVPVLSEGRVIAAVCAGGFELDAARASALRSALAREYGLSGAALDGDYRRSITASEPDLSLWTAQCGMLADFLMTVYASLVRAGVIDVGGPAVGDTTRLNTLTSALEYIHMHYAEDVRLPHIAAFCQCSESYLSRLFNRHMNGNLNQYLNRVRVEKARRLLADGHRVRSAALMTGFSDPNYFSSVFHRIVGQTPTAYARGHGGEEGSP